MKSKQILKHLNLHFEEGVANFQINIPFTVGAMNIKGLSSLNSDNDLDLSDVQDYVIMCDIIPNVPICMFGLSATYDHYDTAPEWRLGEYICNNYAPDLKIHLYNETPINGHYTFYLYASKSLSIRKYVNGFISLIIEFEEYFN